MNARIAVLYSDGSFNVGSPDDDIESSKKKLGYDTADEDAKLVEVDIRVTKIVHQTNPRFQTVTEESVKCPCCGEQVWLEKK